MNPRRFRVCFVDGVPKMESRAVRRTGGRFGVPPGEALIHPWSDMEFYDKGSETEEAAITAARDLCARTIAHARQRLDKARVELAAAEDAHGGALLDAEALDLFAAKWKP